MEERLLSAESSLANRIERVEAMQAELVKARARVEEARDALEHVLASSSWRVTRPLRTLRAMAGALWRAKRDLPRQLVKAWGCCGVRAGRVCATG